jgi:hypothetical protein
MNNYNLMQRKGLQTMNNWSLVDKTRKLISDSVDKKEGGIDKIKKDGHYLVWYSAIWVENHDEVDGRRKGNIYCRLARIDNGYFVFAVVIVEEWHVQIDGKFDEENSFGCSVFKIKKKIDSSKANASLIFNVMAETFSEHLKKIDGEYYYNCPRV